MADRLLKTLTNRYILHAFFWVCGVWSGVWFGVWCVVGVWCKNGILTTQNNTKQHRKTS